MSFSDNAESKQSALDILFKKSVSIEANNAAEQFDKYVCDPSISYNDDPYDWWKHHAGKFPAFVPLAKKYLTIPATSTASERVFSAAGNIVTANRSRLHSNNVDKLIFFIKIDHLLIKCVINLLFIMNMRYLFH